MSANESNTRGYGRIEDEIKTPVLFGVIRDLACDAKDIIECAICEVTERKGVR